MDYLSELPDEIKLLIFSYLDSYTIINLEDISVKLKHISFDRELVGKLCFYNDYRLKTFHVQNRIFHRFRKDIITSLNINCIYWISQQDITRCLELSMLESLYAVDTKLCLKKLYLSNLQHLHTLAVTITNSNYIYLIELRNYQMLKKLFILYDLSPDYQLCIPKFVEKCRNLEELWLLDFSNTSNGSSVAMMSNYPKSVKKLVLLHKGSHQQFDVEYLGFNCVSFKKISNKGQICIEKTDKYVNNIYSDDFYKETIWQLYINSDYDTPLGVDDAKKLVHGRSTLENINYKELSLHHKHSLTGNALLLSSILSLPNMRNLCKLSINMCFCEQNSIRDYQTKLLFKRVGRSAEKSILDNIVEKSPLIEELEIWACDLITKTENCITFNCIKKLQQLKKLTLAGITKVGNASYLLEISQNCPNLKSLRISSFVQSFDQNPSLNNYLCLSLPYLNKLQDLRYEHNYIPFDKVIGSLTKMKSCSVQRIVFKSNKIDRFVIEQFKEFIVNNPQLRFLFLFITDMPMVALKHIAEDLRKLESHDQIFIVSNNIANIKYFVPYIHLFEMIEYNTHVGGLDVFNGFV